MTIPLGHDLSPLAAIVVIKDLNGLEQYRYEMPQVVEGTPVQDFSLKGGTLIKGINADHGSFTFDITDNDELLTDKENPLFPSFIKQGWEVELFLGKDPTTVNLWYTGIINTVKTIQQSKTNTVTVSSYGYGILLASRYSSMNRTQIKLDDGTTPDPSDLSTKATELVKDLLTDTDHLEVPGLGLLDIIPGDIDDLPFLLGDFRKNLVTLGSEYNELAQIVGAYWGVNADKTAFLHQRGTKNSGFLITNDVENPSLITTNWDQQKLAFLKSEQLVRNDTSQNSAITIIHGIGSQRQIVDHKELLQNAVLDTSLENYAFLFKPQKDNVSQISLGMTRTGPITSGINISIIGSIEISDLPNDPIVSPNINDLRETKILSPELLEKELGTGDRSIDIKFNKITVTKDETLFVLIEKSTNEVDILTLEYETGTGLGYFQTNDLQNWGDLLPGAPRFTTYQSKTVKIVGQNTTTQKLLRPKELVVTLPDKPDEETILAILEAMLETKSKIISNYEPITITPPTLPIPLGECIRYIDINSGFEADLDVVGYELLFNAYDKNNLGATEMKIHLQSLYI